MVSRSEPEREIYFHPDATATNPLETESGRRFLEQLDTRRIGDTDHFALTSEELEEFRIAGFSMLELREGEYPRFIQAIEAGVGQALEAGAESGETTPIEGYRTLQDIADPIEQARTALNATTDTFTQLNRTLEGLLEEQAPVRSGDSTEQTITAIHRSALHLEITSALVAALEPGILELDDWHPVIRELRHTRHLGQALNALGHDHFEALLEPMISETRTTTASVLRTNLFQPTPELTMGPLGPVPEFDRQDAVSVLVRRRLSFSIEGRPELQALARQAESTLNRIRTGLGLNEMNIKDSVRLVPKEAWQSHWFEGPNPEGAAFFDPRDDCAFACEELESTPRAEAEKALWLLYAIAHELAHKATAGLGVQDYSVVLNEGIVDKLAFQILREFFGDPPPSGDDLTSILSSDLPLSAMSDPGLSLEEHVPSNDKTRIPSHRWFEQRILSVLFAIDPELAVGLASCAFAGSPDRARELVTDHLGPDVAVLLNRNEPTAPILYEWTERLRNALGGALSEDRRLNAPQSMRAEEIPLTSENLEQIAATEKLGAIDLSSVTRPTQGAQNEVVIFGTDESRFVVRRPLAWSTLPTENQNLRRETRILDLLARNGIEEAPKPIACEADPTSLGTVYLVTTVVPGEPAGDTPEEIESCRRLLSRVHQISLPGAGKLVLDGAFLRGEATTWSDYVNGLFHWNMERLSDHGAIEASLRGQMLDFHNGRVSLVPNDKHSLLHGDTNPGNYLTDGRRATGILDFDFALVGDPMCDRVDFDLKRGTSFVDAASLPYDYRVLLLMGRLRWCCDTNQTDHVDYLKGQIVDVLREHAT